MTHKILVIDDDSRIHTLIKTSFERQRFEIISAHNGAAGLAAASERIPDVILLDVDMNETQGFEVCRRIRMDRLTRSIPVIFLTGAVSVEARIFGLECGAVDYVTKPFHPAELKARVRAALRTKLQMDQSVEHSIYDEVTEMSDRKYFEMRLDADLAIASRSGRPLGCILIDIDNMDLVNTWFGRSLGDDVLRKVGQSIQAVCRREDVVCRFEADEYGILVSDANATNMAELAERARISVRSYTAIVNDRAVQVTASVGFALSRFSIGSSIVHEAQDALCRAQLAGGDCVRAGAELVKLQLVV